MTTTDHPCIERLRPLLEQRRQVDGVLWVLHGLIYLAVALSLVEIVATLVLDGEGARMRRHLSRSTPHGCRRLESTASW
jgi:hypothetical protein